MRRHAPRPRAAVQRVLDHGADLAAIGVMLANPNARLTQIGTRTVIRVGEHQHREYPTELVERAQAIRREMA